MTEPASTTLSGVVEMAVVQDFIRALGVDPDEVCSVSLDCNSVGREVSVTRYLLNERGHRHVLAGTSDVAVEHLTFNLDRSKA